MKIKKANLIEGTFYNIEKRVHYLQEIASLLKKCDTNPVALKCISDTADSILEYSNLIFEYLQQCNELNISPEQRQKLNDDFERSVGRVDCKFFDVDLEIDFKDNEHDRAIASVVV